jgi:hypothetical protein
MASAGRSSRPNPAPSACRCTSSSSSPAAQTRHTRKPSTLACAPPPGLTDCTRIAFGDLFLEDVRAFNARLVCVDTTQLDGSFAGRPFDEAFLADLPASVDPCGERGEFHTFVSAGPGFRTPVPCSVGERVLRDDRFMYCDLIG